RRGVCPRARRRPAAAIRPLAAFRASARGARAVGARTRRRDLRRAAAALRCHDTRAASAVPDARDSLRRGTAVAGVAISRRGPRRRTAWDSREADCGGATGPSAAHGQRARRCGAALLQRDGIVSRLSALVLVSAHAATTVCAELLRLPVHA